MISRTYKLIIRLLLFIILLLVFGIGGTFAWVVSGPRSVAFLHPLIESSFNAAVKEYTLSVGDTFLRWDQKHKVLNVDVKRVKINNQEGLVVVALPELRMHVSTPALLVGKFRPRTLEAIKPAFRVVLSKDQQTLTAEKIKEMLHFWHEQLILLTSSETLQNRLQMIMVEQASIQLVTPLKTVDIIIPQAISRAQNGSVKTSMKGSIDNQPFTLAMELTLEANKDLHAHIIAKSVSSVLAYTVIQKQDVVIDPTMTVDVMSELILPRNQLPYVKSFALTASGGEVEWSGFLEGKALVKKVALKGSVSKDFNTFKVDQGDILMDGSTISLKGLFSLNQGKFQHIKLDGTIEKVPVAMVHALWPTPFLPKVKKWLVANVHEGFVTKAQLHLDVSAWELAHKQWGNDSFDMTISVTGASVSFMPNVNPVTDVDGDIVITSKSLIISPKKGKFYHSAVTGGTITIPDFHAIPPSVDVDVTVEGEVADAMVFFNNKPVDAILQTPLASFKGQASSKVVLRIPIKKGLKYHEISFNINGDVHNVRIPSLFGKYTIDNGIVHTWFDGKSIDIAGKVVISDALVEAKVKQFLPGFGTDYDGRYLLKIPATAKLAKKFGLTKVPDFEGIVPVAAAISVKKGIKDILVKGDLSGPKIVVPLAQWEKKADDPMTFELVASDKGEGVVFIKEFRAYAKDLRTNGSAKILLSQGKLTELFVNDLSLGRHQLRLAYADMNGVRRLDIRGGKLDLSNYNFKSLTSSSSDTQKGEKSKPASNLQEQKDWQVTVKLNEILMKHDERVENVTGKISCRAGLCYSGALVGRLASNSFMSLQLQPDEDNAARLVLEASNAGSFLKAMDIYPTMHGGRLSLKGSIEKRKQNARKDSLYFEGTANLSGFVLTKAPAITKIASLASFEGLSQLITQEKGLKFKRFTIPFAYDNGLVTVAESFASGDAVGFSTAGTIHTDTKELNLRGTFVPAYTVNTLLSKLPIIGAIGEALLGGEGGAIIAVNYHVKGKSSEPEIHVNPLSVLAPGFLRNIFDMPTKSASKPKK